MTGESAIWLWRKALPSTTTHTQRAIACVLQRLTHERWLAKDLFGIQLALEEALTNAVKHGNGEERGKWVHLECELFPHRIRVQIQDEGPGFASLNIADPRAPENLTRAGGRGLLLMRGFMNRVEYLGCGNCVELEKLRTPASAVA